MILHLITREQVEIPARDADRVLTQIRAGNPYVEFTQHAHGKYWLLTIPLTGIAYVAQTAPEVKS